MATSVDISPLLIVDDDLAFVMRVVDFLRRKAIRCDIAHSGPSALTVLREKPLGYYKAMLLDISMKDSDTDEEENPSAGLDILPSIQSHDSDLPVVYLSSHANEDRAIDTISNGAVQMLMKPVNPQTLYYCLISAVLFAKAQREARELALAVTRQRLVTTKLFSHNMKNLAMAGQAYLQLSPPEVDKAKACFDAIQEQTRRIMVMNTDPDVNDIANLREAFEKGKESLRGDPQVSADALSRVTLALSSDVPSLHIKLDTLAAILGELIYNAIVHNERPVRVTGSARVSANGVEVRVEDDGKGVPADRRESLFQVQPGRTEHGFGLPYCYEVLRTHHGDIRYEKASDTAPGAFVFTVPVHPTGPRGRGDAS